MPKTGDFGDDAIKNCLPHYTRFLRPPEISTIYHERNKELQKLKILLEPDMRLSEDREGDGWLSF